MLKVIRKEILANDMHLLERIERSEEQAKAGKAVKADTSMKDEDIDDLLME
ncbi:MAG TPA: hypothetical protein VJJ75_03105 [Candidatus Nanoarchaeia archaeon]|nr:hypothetical protein [Candidatus Nanoarchaeia archaeon]